MLFYCLCGHLYIYGTCVHTHACTHTWTNTNLFFFLKKNIKQPGMVEQDYSPNTWEVEVGRSRVQLGLHETFSPITSNEFKYTRIPFHRHQDGKRQWEWKTVRPLLQSCYKSKLSHSLQLTAWMSLEMLEPFSDGATQFWRHILALLSLKGGTKDRIPRKSVCNGNPTGLWINCSTTQQSELWSAGQR